jgi:hypothetical protein
MTDFRALCAELVAIEDALSGGSVQFSNQGQALDGYSALAAFRDVADRARAALAEQPVVPTDEELCETYRTAYYAEKNRQGPHCMAAGLRAVLARWGQL